jgi:2-polyprenyl-3-methyl-5-hydroxy-6-metoxy-1,4-benzoquinol methylase
MRYVVSGVEIRSENAAKPHSQRSKVVTEYLRKAARVKAVLDFGCGKLRYSDLVAKLGRRATFVDSKVQLTRRQRIRGKMTTVSDVIAERYPHARVVSAEAAMTDRSRYDFVTCINVLSAIPTRSALDTLVRLIRRLTKTNGTAVFVNQHRNSYFKRFEVGKPHLFGHVFGGAKGYSYYGVLTVKRVEKLLLSHGFYIRKSWIRGEINFVEAHPARRRRRPRSVRKCARFA